MNMNVVFLIVALLGLFLIALGLIALHAQRRDQQRATPASARKPAFRAQTPHLEPELEPDSEPDLAPGADPLHQSPPDQPWPYSAKTHLLTRSERILFHRLLQALPDYFVMVQVQLSQVVVVQEKTPHWKKWWNIINQKSLDFVICDRNTLFIAAIELDDHTHSRQERQRADAQKERALRDAGVRLLRWHVEDMPTIEQIRQAIAAIAGKSGQSQPA